MNWLHHVERSGGCGRLSAIAFAVVCCNSFAMNAQHPAATWSAALAARASFEAEPSGTHTRRAYAEVMDGFRAIYHSNPRDPHAARAVAQVAELLSEQGKEFSDKKSLHDAAGQYEFLAKAYPGGSLAPLALDHAISLLGPTDVLERKRVEAQLKEEYPRYSPPAAASESTASVSQPTATKRPELEPAVHHPFPLNAPASSEDTSDKEDAARPLKTATSAAPERQTGPQSVVTGIRHWSTPSYTRVAIDLEVSGEDDVEYQAARVEDPDRIFFDLHHTRLAPQLAGKSFNITDDGFLTRIRAAQFSGEITRVVLDVHGIAEYSAFLLPNPYRLIIDIHRKPGPASSEPELATTTATTTNPTTTTPETAPPAAAADAAPSAQETGRHASPVEVSSLPPMPVTDGSTTFGLPQRRTGRPVTEATVARARVVIPAKPTPAMPVPNTVTKTSEDTGTEVAAVSRQQGKVEATARPTSKPISSGTAEGVAEDVNPSLHEMAATADKETLGLHRRGRIERSEHPEIAAANRQETEAAPSVAPVPTADGETSLTRALGLKIGRIVIDAGHGGHDSGTLGVDGIEEKNVVLDVALRLGKLLHDRLGAEVVYTRANDTFIPLETRTAIANKAQADLFISVHANSSPDESARGVEVYYLNFTSDPEAMRVASRENAVSTESVHELSGLVKKIALKDKIDESRELASDVDASLYAGLRRGNTGLKDRGVKKAPFVVLIGANMPSVLAEISFVTNAQDAAKLETPEYRRRVAESLYRGIAHYAEGINGVSPGPRAVEQAQR